MEWNNQNIIDTSWFPSHGCASRKEAYEIDRTKAVNFIMPSFCVNESGWER
jgi:hypothetical protein